jgi:hypothetical protein
MTKGEIKMNMTDEQIRKIAIESGFWSDSDSWWHDAIPAFKVFAMEILTTPSDQSDKEMFDAQLISTLKDRVKELEEGMREAMRQLEYEEPTSAYKCLDGLLKKAPTDAKCLDELLPKEKQE